MIGNRLFREVAFLVCGVLAMSLGAARAISVVPNPKSLSVGGELFTIDKEVVIEAGEISRVAAEELQRGLEKIHGISLKVVSSDDAVDKRRIVLAVDKVEADAEGYEIKVSEDEVRVSSRSAAGAFYGVQTLKQLLQSDGSRVFVPGCSITDQPAYKWRGTYLNLRFVKASPESMASLKSLFDALAQLKMNVLFLEVADNMLYETQSFPLSAKHAFSKEQIRELVSYAKGRFFEVIPSFQMLSHVPWMLTNPENRSLLEDPTQTGWGATWCPSNPKVEKLSKDVLTETVEVFEPKYCSVGLDEVNQGPFAACAKCRTKDGAQLFLNSVMLQYNILSKLGVKTIMWQDTLLPPDGLYTRENDPAKGWTIVDKIPRDIIMADWYYGQYSSEIYERYFEFFTKKGFSVLSVVFSESKDIKSFAEGLQDKPKMLGMLGTSWYQATDWTNPRTVSPKAWTALVMTAQYAWNPAPPSSQEGILDPINLIKRWMAPQMTKNENWVPLSLSEVFNGEINSDQSSWPGYGKGNTVEGIFQKNISSDGVEFSIGSLEGQKNVVLLTGGNKDGIETESATIPVMRKARAVAFLNSCNVPLNAKDLNSPHDALEMPVVGKYVFNYEDGTSVSMDIVYRWNIMDWNNEMGAFDGKLAYVGTTADRSRVQLIKTDWKNPHPEKMIKDITVETKKYNGTSLAVFAISTQE